MKLIYLISCMNQKNADIIKRTGVQSDVVVINQCDHDSFEEFDFTNKRGQKCHAKFICTTERGLSRSRNMAIRYADGDICQICDDDQTVSADGEEIISKVYDEHPDVGVIAFSLDRKDIKKTYPCKPQKLTFTQILRTNSLQITFRKDLIQKNKVLFDVALGSGTGNGGGEENKFLFDCKKKGIKLFYSPEIIGTVYPSGSQWFKGYTPQFMQNQGWACRRILGDFLGLLYCIHYGFSHRHKYEAMSVIQAWYYLLRGYFDKKDGK